MLNYACHPVILGPKSYALSADFVGRTRQVFESATGAPLLFLQAVPGDLNPLGGVSDRYDNCHTLGTILAAEAVKTYEQNAIADLAPASLAAGRRPSNCRCKNSIRSTPSNVKSPPCATGWPAGKPKGDAPSPRRGNPVSPRTRRAGAFRGAGRALQYTLPFEVQALRLGDIGITAAPAELVRRDWPGDQAPSAAYECSDPGLRQRLHRLRSDAGQLSERWLRSRTSPTRDTANWPRWRRTPRKRSSIPR